MTDRSSDDAKRMFVEQTDEINRRSQVEGLDAEAASDLAEILAEHEQECALLMRFVKEDKASTR